MQTDITVSYTHLARYTEGITDVMSYLGIDTSKDFTVNGMKYSKNKDGWYESEAVSYTHLMLLFPIKNGLQM